MNRRPLHFISREKEWELINKLLTIIDNSQFNPNTTAVLMVSPDYSATIAMHLAHAWSVEGEIIPIIPVDVPYPDESADDYIRKLAIEQMNIRKYSKLILIEAGKTRGGNWKWRLESLKAKGYARDDITLIAMCENINSITKSDFVGEYYDDNKEELMFYYERYNKHWEVR